jgi:hypothetical protein
MSASTCAQESGNFKFFAVIDNASVWLLRNALYSLVDEIHLAPPSASISSIAESKM